MTIKSAKIESFEEYSQFKSLKEFNSHIEQWLALHKREFSKGELIGMKRLIRFSAKIAGGCNAKTATILKNTSNPLESYLLYRICDIYCF
ncbi:hypothetical protein A8F94_08525 [Bacillus sp. FJAT-27225]|uniref:hypothetical protein n=1 Tax=Bacillus sp. FJAT-27225 TaxID=1743144 RepID=UPI00080C23A8|nr:hypothetical protein [Bacillus sp. FJAT-27225]OCA87873.1 hypothetical protein A8F94_08525 [Bacillus sp. FJAT-27225]